MSQSALFITVLSVASIIPRLAPILWEKKLSRVVGHRTIETFAPTILMLGLVIYCYRDLTFNEEGVSRIAAGVLVVLVQLRLRSTTKSILMGTLFYLIAVNGLVS